MMMKHSAEVQGLRTECSSCAMVCTQSSVLSPDETPSHFTRLPSGVRRDGRLYAQLAKGGNQVAGYRFSKERGFTLVEMIMVIVITGIIGGMVAIFIRAPMQGYVDSARRAEMTDIADTALRRITRDLRLALPNSVSVTISGGARGAGGCTGNNTCFIEFLPTGSSGCAAGATCLGGGRYRIASGGTNDILDFTVADNSFEVLGTVPTFVSGDSVVVYNLGIAGADAYVGLNRSAWRIPKVDPIVNINSILFPFDSPSHRFHVISTPVTYVCNPVAGGSGGTLTRYWGYAIQPNQPNGVNASNQLLDSGGAVLANQSRAWLATNVSTCSFTYDPLVSTHNGLVTLSLGITESGSGELPETVTLYNAAHVSNTP